MDTPKNEYTIDEKRKRQNAYEYLCRLEEAKKWLEFVLKKTLPDSSDLETHLRNGIDLAFLANIIAPQSCPRNKIYDPDFIKFEQRGLHFKHTDNIVMFINGCKAAGLPKIFLPETLDLYDAKNTPRVIFCIHALSHYFAKKGVYPLIQNCYGQIEFEEQQLNKVQSALEKHGVKLPAFGKIGGILAAELSEDDAAIHAAVMLISEALESGDLKLFLERLKNPTLNLLRVHDANVEGYFKTMKERKDKKVEAAEKKVKETQEECDVYDKILSQTEIQDCLNIENVETILMQINQALLDEDKEELKRCFISADLGQVGSINENGARYAEFALQYYKKSQQTISKVSLDDVKSIITAVNEETARTQTAMNYISKIQQLIESGDISGLLNAIQTAPPEFKYTDINRANLIFETLKDAYHIREGFDRDTLAATLKTLQLVCAINKAIESNDKTELCSLLKRPELSITGVESDSSYRYLEALTRLRDAKKEEIGNEHCDLMLDEIIGCVDVVNATVNEELEKLEIVTKINDSLDQMTADELLSYLMDNRGKFKHVRPANKDTYLQALIQVKATPGKSDESCIFHERIQETIDEYNTNIEQAEKFIFMLDDINKALVNNKDVEIMPSLIKLKISGLIEECENAYVTSLKDTLSARSVEDWSGWTKHKIMTSGGKSFYYNYKDNKYMWHNMPENYSDEVGYMNTSTIEEVCSKVGSNYNRELYFNNNLELIIFLQKFYLTYRVHHAYVQHLNFIHKELPSVVILQSFVRSLHSRAYYLKCVNLCLSNQEDGGWIKSYARSSLQRFHFKSKMEHYQQNVMSIIAMQAIIRGYITKSEYNNLIHMTKPSLKQLYKYLNLLEPDADDVMEEKEIIRLRNLVYDKIKEVSALEDQIKEMDLIIGLHVQNRINLQDAELRSSKYKKGPKLDTVVTYTKEKLELREKFGQMFYVLQHVPVYISKLLIFLATRKTAIYMRDFFCNLFNLATTPFDEYRILKTFEFMLQEELKEVSTLQDFVKQDALVIRLGVPMFRDLQAPTFNRTMFFEPVNSVLQHKGNLYINPVEVYKQWLSQIEVETGKTSELKYDVTAEEAIKHEEVVNILQKNAQSLLTYSMKMRDSIINNGDLIPYCLRCTAKLIYLSLCERFEDNSQEEINKIVGNVLFYRFINPPIVAPDTFAVVPESAEINPEQRKNLSTVSSILQCSAGAKILEFVHPVMQPLYDFMEESAHKFSDFFLAYRDVPSLEEHYNFNEFSERTLLHQPELKISVDQVLYTHSILMEHSDIIFTHKDDQFFQFLKEIKIGLKPSDLIDVQPHFLQQTQSQQQTQPTKKKGDKNGPLVVTETDEQMMGKCLVLLQINPPKIILESEENRNKEMLNRAINMLVDLLHFCNQESVNEVLECKFSAEKEKKYRELLINREKLAETGQKSTTEEERKESTPETTAESESVKYMTLAQTLEALNTDLASLETSNMMSSENDYHDLLMLVVKRVVDRTQYVKRRKTDICRYRTTIDDLESKLKSLAAQQNSYNLYIQGCMGQMAKKSKKKTKQIEVKKSAAKLHQKGIIVEIDEVAVDSYKTIMVSFTTTDTQGVYIINGTILGAKLATYRLEFSSLLWLQFQQVNITKILGIVKVRVNLLVKFINDHFHH